MTLHPTCVCVHAKSHQFCPTICTLWTVALQAAGLPISFSRQEYWNGLPCPPPGDLPNPGITLTSHLSSTLTGRFFTTAPPVNQGSPDFTSHTLYLIQIAWFPFPHTTGIIWSCPSAITYGHSGFFHLCYSNPAHSYDAAWILLPSFKPWLL